VTPHEPQLLMVEMAVWQPDQKSPGTQSAKPAEHWPTVVHWPPEQVPSVSVFGALHRVPQAPQLDESEARLTQAPPQKVWPGGHTLRHS
jgi:hypothetical protein